LIETSLATGRANLYWVCLEFPESLLAPVAEWAVASLALPPSLHAYHGVIGRDLLRRWEYLHFEGRVGRMTIRDTPAWFVRLFRQ
jgi:hypothetical protein